MGRTKKGKVDLMSVKFSAKMTKFPQTGIKRNFPKDFTTISRTFRSHDDAATFFMLADATCSTKHKVDIERVHVNVFQKCKVVRPVMLLEDEEYDSKLRKEIQSRREDAAKGNLVSWDKVKMAI